MEGKKDKVATTSMVEGNRGIAVRLRTNTALS